MREAMKRELRGRKMSQEGKGYNYRGVKGREVIGRERLQEERNCQN